MINKAMNREIIKMIYEFDPTYHNHMKKCHGEIRRYHQMRIRISREIQTLENEPEMTLLSKISNRLLTVSFRDRIFKIQIPIGYPFNPPILSLSEKKLPVFDLWSPAARLATAILVYDVEETMGYEICS